jgi:hypothetical protein
VNAQHSLIPEKPRIRLSKNNLQAVLCIAGFRPGRRATFGWAKVAKTIDAQPGHIT